MALIDSWTNEVNYFVLGSSIPYSTAGSSSQYAQGGPFAQSEISQTVSIPDGWQYGEAVLLYARANAFAGDKGEVILEALDASDNVLEIATSGETWYAELNTWHRERVVLRLPPLAAKLRIRLRATRILPLGDCGACFDDFTLRVHKDLAPVDALALDFSTLPVQPTPTTWQRFHLAWPHISPSTPAVVIAQGVLAVSSHRSYPGETITWSDGQPHEPGTFVAPFGGGVERLPSFAFERSTVDVQVSGGTTERGAFTSATSFSVSVTLKIDEVGFSVAAGICGRRLASGIGWGLNLTASGQPRAVLQGTAGTRTVTASASIADGAAHRLTMVYDAPAQMLRLYVDRRAVVETSTATGLGEFAVASAPLRIGRDSPASVTCQCQILDVVLLPVALTADEARSLWRLGSDPSGEIDTYTRSSPVWVELAGGSLACLASDQIAIGYDHATGITGLATCHAFTELSPSRDFSLTKWLRDKDAELDVGVIDPTGLPRGASILTTATDGVYLVDIPVSSVTHIGVTFWSRAVVGAPELKVRLLNEGGTMVDQVSVNLAPANLGRWMRYDVMFTSWDGSSSLCKVQWIGDAAFELCHVVSVYQPASADAFQFPTVIPRDAGGSLSSSIRIIAMRNMPSQWSAEGEIDIQGVAMTATPPTGASIVEVNNPASANNRRSILLDTARPEFRLFNGSGSTASTSRATAINWRVPWRLRARWNRGSTLDPAATPYGGIIAEGSVSSADYAQAAAWTDDPTTPITRLDIGTTSVSSGRLAALVERVVLRTPGRKLV